MTKAANINTSLFADFQNRVNTICTKRSTWQQTQFKSANDALYNLLGEIYDISQQFNNSSEFDAQKYDWLLSECNTKGVKLNKKPTFLQLLVKYVFTDNDTDSRRISSYARVLNAATQSSEVNCSADVAKFIRKYGGVEEIRASLAKNTKTPLQRAASGRSILFNNKTLTTVSTAETTQFVAKSKDKIVLLVGVINAQGKVDVKHICYEIAPSDSHLSAKSAVNSALSNLYSTKSKEQRKTAKRRKEEKDIHDKNSAAMNINAADNTKAAA